MKRKRLNIVDEIALSRLDLTTNQSITQPSYGDWIRILRTRLRMSQADLAERAHVSQSHLAGIEGSKIDPQVSTLKRIFDALSCNMVVVPSPKKPIDDFLRGQARSVALKRLKHAMGTMALEGQAPDGDVFRQLLEKRTNEILSDPREKLWHTDHD